ncbi:Mov34/MPN/PAD-1 family protein [Alkalibacillus aidingensis]|uniref:Mov34/MPN/PAD-1 family protein n=1 Tax=Alkalibacillus aidingensis TaxID=2747607 RepID=UPI0016605B19
MNTLFISKKCYQDLLNHAKVHYPYECCGLLSGKFERAEHFWILHNQLKSSKRFLVKPDDLLNVIDQIKHQKEQLLANFILTHIRTALLQRPI